MLPGNTSNAPLNGQPVRKAMVIDADSDRYRRKERTGSIQNLGFKVYPVLRIQEARTRCKPGVFDLIVVNVTENLDLALELCDAIRQNDPKQQLFLVSSGGSVDRDYALSSWQEVLEKIAKNQPQSDTKRMVA
jgi:PleD family two-component response regulator